MRVLLIEPDQILAKAYVQAFEGEGNAVTRVADAQTAIHAADKTAPDVIVLELQLQAHNGVEFLYELRSYPEWSTIPVLLHTFVTASRLQAQREVLSKLGVVEYLYKPVTDLQKLISTVNAVVQPVT